MKENIKTIKFTGIFSILFALLTYIITLNMEIGFFQPNWIWISNNFALTICGGAFASFLVVMLCEFQKYWSNKAACENSLFYQTMYLYIELHTLYKNVEEYLSDKEKPVLDNMMDMRIQRAHSHVTAIQCIEYITFGKQSLLEVTHHSFCMDQLVNINLFLMTDNFLKIAISKTKISNIEKGQNRKIITSSDALVEKTLKGIHNSLGSLLSDISNHLQVVDRCCNKRFDWGKQRDTIQNSYIKLSEVGQFEDFLKNVEEAP